MKETIDRHSKLTQDIVKSKKGSSEPAKILHKPYQADMSISLIHINNPQITKQTFTIHDISNLVSRDNTQECNNDNSGI